MSKKPKIYADFQKLDDEGRLILICAGTKKDIEDQGVSLSPGTSVIFYSDDCADDGAEDELMVDGSVEYDEDNKRWVGLFDSNGFRHASDDKA